jgi:MFS transporter, DHA1 family, multidrug resistance protein
MGLRIPRISLGLDPDNRLMFWGMFFNEAGIGIFITLWPLYIGSLGASPAQIGFIIGLWGFARLGFLLPSGFLIERVPPRTLILATRLGAILGFALLSLAQSWWHLFPGVILMAASTASFPVISSVIADVAGRGRARARAFTMILNVGPSAALLITPALGGILAEQISLRAIFVAAAIFNVCGLLVFSRMSNREVRVQQGPPVTYTETFGHAGTRTILILAFVVVFCSILGVTLVPNLLQDVHAVSVGQIGYLGSLAAVGSISLGLILSNIKIFENSMLSYSLAISSVAMALMLFVFGQSIWIFAIAFIFRGGLLATFSVMYATLSDVTPDRIRNRAYVAAEFMAGIGFALAPFAAGWFFEIRPELPMIVGMAVLIPIIAGVLVMSRRLAAADESAQTG